MNSNPKLWNKLLAGSPKGSVLMGGAIVDYEYGIDPKDYDIFYSYQPGMGYAPPANWIMTPADFNNEDWVFEHQEQYMQGVDANGFKPIASVTEYLVDNEHKVQLIGVLYPKPLLHFRNFDHSLTLGYYTGRGMYIHYKALESMADFKITYVSKNKDPVAQLKSLARAFGKAKRYSFGNDIDHWKFEGFNNQGE